MSYASIETFSEDDDIVGWYMLWRLNSTNYVRWRSLRFAESMYGLFDEKLLLQTE